MITGTIADSGSEKLVDKAFLRPIGPIGEPVVVSGSSLVSVPVAVNVLEDPLKLVEVEVRRPTDLVSTPVGSLLMKLGNGGILVGRVSSQWPETRQGGRRTLQISEKGDDMIRTRE
jgi:hypothetical protein